MTKREIVSLLIVFLGVWLLFQSVFILPGMLSQLATNDMGDFRYAPFFIPASIYIFQILLFALLGLCLIKKSSGLAEIVVRAARINGEEKSDVLFADKFFPLFISLVGLYYLISNFPYLVTDLGQWFSSNAKADAVQADIHQQNLIRSVFTVGISIFVFLRSDLLVKLVNKYRKP